MKTNLCQPKRKNWKRMGPGKTYEFLIDWTQRFGLKEITIRLDEQASTVTALFRVPKYARCLSVIGALRATIPPSMMKGTNFGYGDTYVLAATWRF